MFKPFYPSDSFTQVQGFYFEYGEGDPAFVVYEEDGSLVQVCEGNNLFSIDFSSIPDFEAENLESTIITEDNTVREGFGRDPGENIFTLTDEEKERTDYTVTRDSFYRHLLCTSSSGDMVGVNGDIEETHKIRVYTGIRITCLGVKPDPTEEYDGIVDQLLWSYNGRHGYKHVIQIFGTVNYTEFLIDNYGTVKEKLGEGEVSVLDVPGLKLKLRDYMGQGYSFGVDDSTKTFYYYEASSEAGAVVNSAVLEAYLETRYYTSYLNRYVINSKELKTITSNIIKFIQDPSTVI